jgi:hypothetical protein
VRTKHDPQKPAWPSRCESLRKIVRTTRLSIKLPYRRTAIYSGRKSDDRNGLTFIWKHTTRTNPSRSTEDGFVRLAPISSESVFLNHHNAGKLCRWTRQIVSKSIPCHPPDSITRAWIPDGRSASPEKDHEEDVFKDCSALIAVGCRSSPASPHGLRRALVSARGSYLEYLAANRALGNLHRPRSLLRLGHSRWAAAKPARWLRILKGVGRRWNGGEHPRHERQRELGRDLATRIARSRNLDIECRNVDLCAGNVYLLNR